MKMSKIKKIFLSAIILVFISVLVYSGTNIFKSKNNVEVDKFKVFNPVTDNDSAVEGTSHLTFDAFFLSDEDGDGEAEGYHGAEILNGNSQKLYLELNITGDVTLRNAKLTFVNDNVEVSGTIPRSSLFEKSYYSDNFDIINIKDVGNGVSSFFSLNIKPVVDTDISKFAGVNKVILTGDIYDASTGTETPITKEVVYSVNAYAENISYYYEDTDVNASTVGEIMVRYDIKTTEGYNQMPLSETHLDAVVSQLKGTDPLSVYVYANDNPDNFEYTYDPATRTINAKLSANVEGNIVNKKAYSYVKNKRRITEWHVIVNYPYDESIKNELVSLSTSVWATGIKDTNGTTQDSKKKNTVLSQLVTALVSGQGDYKENSTVKIGEYIPKTDNSDAYYFIDKSNIISAYEGEDHEDVLFEQQWHLDLITASDTVSNLMVRDNGIVGGARDLSSYITYDSMIVRPNSYYNRDRALTIYNDETNEALFLVNNDNYNTKLTFPNGVHKIRIESSSVDELSHLDYYIDFTRIIDTSKIVHDFARTDFNVGNLKNTIEVWAKYDIQGQQGETGPIPHDANATFNDQVSFVDIKSNKETYSRAVSEQSIPMTLTLSTNYEGPAYKKWENGIFYVKIPEMILDTKNLDVYSDYFDIQNTEKISNNSGNFLRIQFSAKDTVYGEHTVGGTNGSINVEFNAVVNPRQTNDVATFELYGKNLTNTRYQGSVADMYDIDSNYNVSESIAKATKQVHISIPTEVITSSSITDYDSFDSTVISPLVANVNPLRGSSDATMNVFLLNYSNNNIDHVYFIGKTGFIGNTYQVGEGDLGTTFDSFMDGPITYDSSLNGVVTVYYSDQENPTNNLSDLSNNWTTTPSDYHDVKSYMIVFNEDYVINVGTEVEFSYPIELPTDSLALNKVSYYTHGAYYNYITSEGSYSSSASSGKLGVRMARTYDLHVQLYKKFAAGTPILSGDFKLTNKNEPEDSRMIHISRGGFADLEGLIVNDEYEITQISADKSAVVDPEARSFKVISDANDQLVIQDSGNFRRIAFNSEYNLEIDLENDVWYQTYFHNYDFDTNDPVRAIYKITGKNYENGFRFELDQNGTYTLKYLVPNEVYKVEQIFVDGYVKTKSFEFKVVRDTDDHSFDVTTRKAPTITRSGDCDSDVNTSTNYNGQVSLAVPSVYPSSAKDIKCNISVNLAGYKDNYEISGNAEIHDDFINGDSRLDVSLSTGMDYTTAPALFSLGKNPDYEWYSSGSIDGNYSSFYLNKASTMRLGSLETINLKGGSDYNLYVNYHRSNVNISSRYNPNAMINRITLTHLNGTIDELYQNKTKTNVVSSDNPNVTQSIYNHNPNEFGNPVLQLDIVSRGVIKKNFEITKVDATTGDPLEGAIFKISGPGIPDGTVLNTDSNGKASIDLNLSFMGSYYNIPGVGNNSEYPLNNMYTIQEIYAPDGYTINGKKINFMIVANYDYNNNATYSVSYTSNNKFTSESATDTGLFKATIEDYPLFKVVKKDIETGEVLPNTYYSIYAVDPVTLELKAAKNIYGNMVGEPTMIDGTEYYIVKTDENGEFTLALNAGTYKLVEVQASDEKYDITDQETYFSIGESQPYQARGTSIVGMKVIEKPTNEPSSTPKLKYTYTTNDKGTLVLEPEYNNGLENLYLVKYDENFNEVWRTVLKNTNYFSPMAEYFDRPGVIVPLNDIDLNVPNSNPNISNTEIITEEEDGYFAYFGGLDVFKVDKQDGHVIYNSAAHPYSRMRYYYTDLCDKQDGVDYPDYLLKPGDDEHYYCNQASTVNINVTHYYYWPYVFDSNSNGTVQAYSLYKGTQDAIQLSDGTIIQNLNHQGENLYLIKEDKNGRYIEAFDATAKIDDALNEILAANGYDVTDRYQFTGTSSDIAARWPSKIKYFDDGSILLLLNRGSIRTESGSTSLQMSFAIKFDPQGEVEYFTPLGIHGNSLADSYAQGIVNVIESPQTYFMINDDGSFDVPLNGPTAYLPMYGTSRFPELYKDDYLENDIKISQFQADHNAVMWVNPQMLHYNSDGQLKSRVLIQNNASLSLDFGFDGYAYNSVHASGSPFINRVEDGYIVGQQYNKDDYGSDSDESFRLVILRNGEHVYLNKTDGANFIIYKVNDDSSVEWIKQYQTDDAPTNSDNLINTISNMNNGLITISVANDSKKLKDINGDEYIVAKDSDIDSHITLVRFELSDEFIPEAPAAVNLELNNKRKEFKVNIQSNDDLAGTFTIQSPSNPEYVGVAPGDVEVVKFGDNSVDDITITPFAGYNVKKITVNGQPLLYQSDINGVIHLDKFNDVRENKNIYVEFEESEARVLVHHYLENTTISIAPDETISGRIGQKYITNPQESGTYALLVDAEDNSVYPENYQGVFTVAPIEVTYYYVPVVSLEVNYLDQDSYAKLANTITTRAPQGTSYNTVAKNIRSFTLAGILGTPNGTMDDDLTEVSYLYNRNSTPQTTVITRFVEEGTNRDIVPPVEDYYDRGLTYTTVPLTNPPAPYIFVRVEGSESGTVGDSDITVIYYYAKQTGEVITEYRDDVTNETIAPSNTQVVVYGERYNTSPLSTIPSGYSLSRTPDNASDVVSTDTTYVVYLYHKDNTVVVPDRGTVTSRYLDISNNKAIFEPITKTYDYGETYETTKLAVIPESYEFVKVEGKETGVVNSPETIVTYWYKKINTPINTDDNKPGEVKEDVPNPKTNDNIMTYVIILSASLVLLTGFIVYKKKKQK